MTIILLQALIALGAILMMIVGVAIVLIPIVTMVWSEITIRKLKTQNQKLTFRQQAQIIGQKLLYTVCIVLLLLCLLLLGLQFMDLSIT